MEIARRSLGGNGPFGVRSLDLKSRILHAQHPLSRVVGGMQVHGAAEIEGGDACTPARSES